MAGVLAVTKSPISMTLTILDMAGAGLVRAVGPAHGIGVRAASLLRRAGPAGRFQGAVSGGPLAGRATVRIGMAAA